MISLLIDAVVLTVLVIALIWGAVLARRIARLQAALLDLAPALQAFCDAVEQSERSVEEIRRETDRMSEVSARSRSAAAATATPARPAAPEVDRQDLVRRFFAAARSRNEV